jgi:predicted dehydrogenase
MIHGMAAIRFGLIGLGNHGLRYARHLARNDVRGASLAVVCRRDRMQGEAAARELGVPFADDYRRVLSDRSLDAVAIVVPCHLHQELVPEALEAGKAVLVEKPLAPDAEGARRIQEAVSRASRPAMVAQTLRFNAVIQAIRERSGDLGAIRFLALSQRFEPARRGWLDESASGGILRNTGVHSFDLIRHLSGLEVEEVSCFQTRQPGRRMEDSFGAVLRLEEGVLATVDNARTTASRSGRIDLVCERGQLTGDHVHHRLAEIRGTTLRELDLPGPVPTVRACLEAFTAAVRGEGPVPIPVSEGTQAMVIVDACRESAETGLPRKLKGIPRS